MTWLEEKINTFIQNEIHTKYRQSIHSQIESLDPLRTEAELYHTIDKITTAIQQASDDHIPVNTIQTHRPILLPQYLPLIKQSRAFNRDYQRTNNPESLRLHRQLQRTDHKYLKAYKLRQWVKTCNSLADNSHSTKFWKHFSILTGQLKTELPLAAPRPPTKKKQMHSQNIYKKYSLPTSPSIHFEFILPIASTYPPIIYNQTHTTSFLTIP